MAIIGAKEIAKALKQISSSNAKAAAKGLETALGIEHESIIFYSAQAEKAQDAQLKEFFVFLSGQGKQHFAALESLLVSLKKNRKFSAPKLSKFKSIIFSKKDPGKEMGSRGIEAVLFALWKEKQAQEFYSGIAEKTGVPAMKKFFSSLASFEKGHAEMLSELAENSFYSRELIMG